MIMHFFVTKMLKCTLFCEQRPRSMQYAASMKPFQRTKHGRDAWLALVRRGKAISFWSIMSRIIGA
jgi:hypothetical protein